MRWIILKTKRGMNQESYHYHSVIISGVETHKTLDTCFEMLIHLNCLRGILFCRNVVKNYHQTGYFWEQYDQKTGKGQGTPMFTGWTSLVLLIMAEDYNAR